MLFPVRLLGVTSLSTLVGGCDGNHGENAGIARPGAQVLGRHEKKDADTAAWMTDDGCIIVGAQGVSSIDRATMGELTQEGKWQLQRFMVDEKNAQVRFIRDDVALVAYKVNERLVVDGEELDLDANDSSVWVRQNGEWLCAMHTESISGDAFGRDRK
jgi:hypothetical protein